MFDMFCANIIMPSFLFEDRASCYILIGRKGKSVRVFLACECRRSFALSKPDSHGGHVPVAPNFR